MMVFLDGIIFSLQRYGGISVYYRQLISHLTALGVPFRLNVENPVVQDLTDLASPRKTEQRDARIFERYRSCRVGPRSGVFHSSYYRLPSRTSIPSVVTVHDFIYENFRYGPRRWVHTRQKHKAIKLAKAVICISESTREDLIKWVGVGSGQAVYVIPNGVSRTFKPIFVDTPRRPFILYVGERGGYKNFPLVLAGLHHLQDYDLVCVGGGKLSQKELNGCTSNVQARVRHLGLISEEALNVAYNQAVCLVYPSLYEGFGIPVIEAMRAGCPVISLNCRAVVEVGGEALERLDEEDPVALANAVQKLRDPGYRAQRVIAGLQRSEIYDWGRCHTQTLAVYQSLLA